MEVKEVQHGAGAWAPDDHGLATSFTIPPREGQPQEAPRHGQQKGKDLRSVLRAQLLVCNVAGICHEAVEPPTVLLSTWSMFLRWWSGAAASRSA